MIRVDQGKIKSVGDSSITLVENDESEVTIAVDADTKVLGKPGSETSVSDLKAGQKVVVSGPEGEAAKTIAVPPKKGEQGPKTAAPHRPGQMPPPPGRARPPQAKAPDRRLALGSAAGGTGEPPARRCRGSR